jgi:hypothetical protein
VCRDDTGPYGGLQIQKNMNSLRNNIPNMLQYTRAIISHVHNVGFSLPSHGSST